MTPEQMRVRAFKNIESAKALLESDPDLASYTVGYALEYVLKARFCSKVGLVAFPVDLKDAKRLQVAHAFTHNLDTLLRLTDDEGVSRGTEADVDWAAAADWGVERRYTPVGDRSADQAAKQIAATERVCIKLCLYEVIDRLQRVEVEAARERGPFNFFAFCRSRSFPWWELLVAFWALDDGERADREDYIDDLITKHLDRQLEEFIGGIRFISPSADELQPFYATVGMFLGSVQHAIRASFSHNTVVGMLPMPPAYIVTCGCWSQEAVLERVRTLRSLA
jgi:hypothetical protein